MFQSMRRSIMSWIHRVAQDRASSSAEFLFYLLALALCVVGLASRKVFWAAAACCAVGFTLWALPKIKSAWRSRWGKVVVTLLHGLALLLALAFARRLLAEALGLPPQDFDWSERTLTAFLYPAAWAVVLVVVAALTQLWLISSFALTHLFDEVRETFRFLRGMFTSMRRFGTEKATVAADLEGPAGMRRVTGEVLFGERIAYLNGRPRDRSRKHLLCHLARKEVRKGGRLIGVMVVAVAAIWVHDGSIYAARAAKPFVRMMAYFADYQSMSAYPGVRGNEQAHLHENGVVSYAAKRGMHIEITVERVAVAVP